MGTSDRTVGGQRREVGEDTDFVVELLQRLVQYIFTH
jgi:hypothetical protein